MPALNYDFVYFASGPHTRQPRTIGGNGGFTSIGIPPGAETLQTGSSFQLEADLLPPTQTVNGVTYEFAYVNVSGGTGGGVTSFDIAAPPPAVTVGSAPITVLVVYLPTGGGGGGTGSGATIDAFDESTGLLVDDTFVTVTPDNGQTHDGNVDGFVVTTNTTETIAALTVITPTGADFDKWVDLGSPTKAVPGVTISGASLTVDKTVSVSALAFYKTPPPVVTPPPNVCLETLVSIAQMSQEGRILVSKVPGLKAELLHCLETRQITETQYNTALNELEHPAVIQTPPKPTPGP